MPFTNRKYLSYGIMHLLEEKKAPAVNIPLANMTLISAELEGI